MTLNYVLLAITGIYSVAVIVKLAMGKGWLSRRISQDIFAIILFILVLVATVMGMDYESFRAMIEGRPY